MAARITVIGEALVDALPSVEVPGGSPANVSVALGRLGHESTLITTLGDDARGRLVKAWLKSAGVRVIASPTATGRTSVARVTLDDEGSASYTFDLTWNPDPAVAALAAGNCEVLHVGSIATVLEPGASLLEALSGAAGDRSLVSFDPNARPAITPDVDAARAQVERLVAQSHVVKVSSDDLAWYYPDEYPLDIAEQWASMGPGLVVVTFGEDGAAAFPHKVHVPGVKVKVADTVGAGDSFMGALLDGLVAIGVYGSMAGEKLAAVDRSEIERILTRANRAAATNVARPGCNPVTTAELDG